MFVTANQLDFFLSSTFFGIIFAIIYQFVKPINAVKLKWLKIITQVLIFLFFARLFIYFSNLFNFGNLRLYMLFGVFCGFILFDKSVGALLAFLIKKLYNKINIKRKGNKKKCKLKNSTEL